MRRDMKTFKQYLEESEASGWLKPNGSAVFNRSTRRDKKGKRQKLTHGDTYSNRTGVEMKDTIGGFYHDYEKHIEGALKKGWTRFHIEHDPESNTFHGVVQGQQRFRNKPRHQQAIERIKKVISGKSAAYKKHKDEIERFRE